MKKISKYKAITIFILLIFIVGFIKVNIEVSKTINIPYENINRESKNKIYIGKDKAPIKIYIGKPFFINFDIGNYYFSINRDVLNSFSLNIKKNTIINRKVK